MSHVVFLRGANVGGNNVFRPAQLAADLAHLGVVNIGAAGTFVVRGKRSAASIRREILARLGFEPSIAIRPAEEILALVHSRPFAGVKFTKEMRGWVAVLCGPRKLNRCFRSSRRRASRGASGSNASRARLRLGCGTGGRVVS